jgi:hypothetical protein
MTREELIKSVGCNPNLANEWIENTYAKYFNYRREGDVIKHGIFDKYVLAFINNQRLNTTLNDEEIRKQLEPLALLIKLFDRALEASDLLCEVTNELLETTWEDDNEEEM